MKDLQLLVRPNIWSLEPYSSARDEYKGHEAHVFLDANESPYNEPYNRYPDPLQTELKKLVSQEKDVPEANIFVGNGSSQSPSIDYSKFTEQLEDGKIKSFSVQPANGVYKISGKYKDEVDKNFIE